LRPKTIVSLVVLALILVILLQNTTVITLRFLFWDTQISQAIVGILLLVLGILVGYVLAKIPRRKKSGGRGAAGGETGGTAVS
jgi:uncharacterized integral membrane protein